MNKPTKQTKAVTDIENKSEVTSGEREVRGNIRSEVKDYMGSYESICVKL